MKKLILLFTLFTTLAFGQSTNPPIYDRASRSTIQYSGLAPKIGLTSITDSIGTKSPIFRFLTGRIKFKNMATVTDTANYNKVLVASGDSLAFMSRSFFGGGGSFIPYIGNTLTFDTTARTLDIGIGNNTAGSTYSSVYGQLSGLPSSGSYNYVWGEDNTISSGSYNTILNGGSSGYGNKILGGSWQTIIGGDADTIYGGGNNNTISGGEFVSIKNGHNAFANGFVAQVKNAYPWGAALGSYVYTDGSYAMGMGYNSLSNGQGSVAWGHVENWNGLTSPSGIPLTTSSGKHAFNLSTNSHRQTTGHGALADFSFIAGGMDANIPVGAKNSVVIGGNAIKARTDSNQVYVPNLNIVAAPTYNDTLSAVLVRDKITGEIKTRNASSFGSGSGTVTSVTSSNSDISLVNPTTTPVLTLNSGTGANQIVKRDGSGNIAGYTPTTLPSGQINIGDGTNTAFPRTLSGDVTINNLGVTTVDSINGVTKSYYDPISSIQTQLNSKQATIGLTTTGAIGAATYSNPTLNIPRGYDELGTLGSLLSYSGSQWNSSSTWNIVSAGGSFAYGSSKLALSGTIGTTTFTNYVFNTTVLGTSSSYLSNLDTHEEIIQCSPTTTPSATTYGFSVGLIPQGVCYQTGLAIKVDWTSTNFGKIYIFVNGGGGYSLSATSNNGLATATAGDGYLLSIKTIKGNITATLTCTSSATAANVGLSSYVTLTNTVPSTYVYGFFQHGGTTDITSLACNSQLATGAEVCFIGTSITRGSTPVDVNYRYADVISQNCKGRFIINAGNGNCSAAAYYTSTQVLSLAPKTIFIEIGINDWAFGVSNVTYMSNLALLVGTFTSNGYTLGVNLFILSIPPTNTDVSGVIQTWNTTLRSTYPSAYIDIYTELKDPSNPNNLATAYNSGDNLHWNTLGHQTVGKLLINRLPSVFTTKDVNRAGFQPLLFSQHSLNKAGLLSISALGIGSSNPQAVVHAVGTTGIRVDRNGTNYTNLTTNASGGFLVTPNGGQTIIAGNSTANALLVSDASNASGAIIGLVGGGSNPSKYIRANAGNFEVINDAFSDVLMSISNEGRVSIGGVVPSAKLHVTSTTAQLRLDYSSSFHTTFTTSSAGNLTVTPNGGNVTLTGAGGSAILLNLSDPSNSIGCNIRLEGGGSNPSKYIRANAGNLEVVNNAYNSILFTVADNGNVTLNGGVILKSYTVATLPTPVTNMVVVVTDALAPTYNATVTGGGSVRTILMYDGASWKCH